MRRTKSGCGCSVCVGCRCNINPSFPIDNVNDDKVDDDCDIDYDDINDIDIDLMMHIMTFVLMDELNDWNDWNDSNDCRCTRKKCGESAAGRALGRQNGRKEVQSGGEASSRRILPAR